MLTAGEGGQGEPDGRTPWPQPEVLAKLSMTKDDLQATHTPTAPRQPPARRETSVIYCPTCHAHLLTCRVPSALAIEIKCQACSRRQKRGVYHNFEISHRPADTT